MAWGKLFRQALLATGIGLSFSTSAQALCDRVPEAVFEDTADMGSYDPFVAPVVRIMRIRITNPSDRPCSFSLSFHSQSLPATMSGPDGVELSYTAESGGSQVMTDADHPELDQRLDMPEFAPHEERVQSVNWMADSSQFVAAGDYSRTVVAFLFDRTDSDPILVYKYELPVTATVIGACSITPPVDPALNLSSAIGDGNTDPGTVFGLIIPNAKCTAPATLILSGDAMQQTPSADGGAGFQGYIDWSATAAYGNAEVTFMTDGLNEVVPARSDRTNADSGTGDGEVRVDVSLQGNARPLLAGHYTGTLTLVLNPLP